MNRFFKSLPRVSLDQVLEIPLEELESPLVRGWSSYDERMVFVPTSEDKLQLHFLTFEGYHSREALLLLEAKERELEEFMLEQEAAK